MLYADMASERMQTDPEEKAGFLTLHTLTMSVSEEVERGGWGVEMGEKEGATSPLFPSSLCISLPRPFAQGLSHSVIERHCIKLWCCHQSLPPVWVPGALTQSVWLLNSSCTYKKVLKWIWLTSGDGWANSSWFTETAVSKGNDSGESCAPPPNPTAHPRSSQNSQHCA